MRGTFGFVVAGIAIILRAFTYSDDPQPTPSPVPEVVDTAAPSPQTPSPTSPVSTTQTSTPTAIPTPAPTATPTPETKPVVQFTSVSASPDHTCGLRANGSVECWGDDEFGQASPPDGKFVSVSAGGASRMRIATTPTSMGQNHHSCASHQNR